MTTTAEGLADIMVELLQEAGVANGNVLSVRAYATQQEQLPQIQLAMPDEEKLGRHPNGPYFTVLATIPLLIEVQAPASPDEAGAAQVRGALLDIARQVERAVIGHPRMDALVQRYAFVKAHGRADGKGEAVTGQRVMTFGLEFVQGPEDFYEPTFDDLEEVSASAPLTDLSDPPPPPAGWEGEPTAVFDFPPQP